MLNEETEINTYREILDSFSFLGKVFTINGGSQFDLK